MQNQDNIDVNLNTKTENKFKENIELENNTCYCTPKRKNNILSRIKSANNRIGLSPISEITCELHETFIISPKIKNQNIDDKKEENDVPLQKDSKLQTSQSEEKKKEDENQQHEGDNENSLISNNFTINSGGRDFLQRRIESRVLSVQRRQNAEPFTLRYDDTDIEEDDDVDDDVDNAYNHDVDDILSFHKNNDDDDDDDDDLSFYGNTTHNSSQNNSPSTSGTRLSTVRPLSPLLDCSRLLSPECSPKRFKVTSTMVTMIDRRKQQPVDDIDGGCSNNSINSNFSSLNSINNNSNSCNSYDAFPFKFAEPQLLSNTTTTITNKLEPSPRKLFFTTTTATTTTTTTTTKTINDNKMQSYTTTAIMPGQQQSFLRTNDQKTPPSKSFRVFNSLSSTESMESMDDEYMDFLEMDSLEDDTQFPSDLKSLISGHIKAVKTSTTPEVKKPLIRRCLSMQDNNILNRVRSTLFEPRTPEILKPLKDNNLITPLSHQQGERCFKRPEPPTPSSSPLQNKRYKMENINEKENDIFIMSLSQENPITTSVGIGGRPLLRKSMSMNDAQIMTALARSSSEPDLIGDFSKPFCLPLMEGRHRDLKSISNDTMAKLIHGEYKNSVSSFKIIDCRYPYEYEGGHIRGATNLYTHEQILNELVNCKTESPTVQEADAPKRHILVFHCEFSSERGPKLSRFLRNHDRLRNSSKYPALHYPEIYLLHGGYKEFFEKYSELCEPISYRPMLDPSFGALYKQFRAKSKSWNGDTTKLGNLGTLTTTTTTNNNNLINRTRKSRSRLVL